MNVLKSSLDARYDYTHLMKCMFKKMRGQDIYHEAKFEKNVVCTDLIFYSLHTASERFRQVLKEKIQLLDFRIVGTFSADDLDHLSRLTNFFSPVVDREIHNNTRLDVEQLYDNMQRLMIVFNFYRIMKKPMQIPKEIYKFLRKRNRMISPLRAFQVEIVWPSCRSASTWWRY